MKKLIFLLAFPILLLLSGCESPAKPPHIVLDSIGLQKIPLKESGITSYTQVAVFNLGVDPEHRGKYTKDEKDVEEKMDTIFGRDVAWWYCEVRFKGKDYFLLNYRNRARVIEMIGKQDKKTVLKFSAVDVPSFPIRFTAFEVTMNAKPYLFIYADIRGFYGCYNLSEFFVVDQNFQVVYHEELTRAKEIGWTADKRYGNCIVLRSFDGWRKFTDDEWQPINGDWVYYLP